MPSHIGKSKGFFLIFNSFVSVRTFGRIAVLSTDTKMRGKEFHRLRLIHLISCMCRSEVRSDNLGLFKAGLHYGDYRSRLMHYEAQKKIFSMLKKP
jgi:hypothetical protein